MEKVRIKLSALWVALMLNLPVGGCAANIQRRLRGRRNRGHANHTGHVFGIGRINGDPDCDGFPGTDLEISCKSLGKHHRGRPFFRFNAVGLPTYPSAYDQFLIVVGLVFNGLTVWYAWKWNKK